MEQDIEKKEDCLYIYPYFKLILKIPIVNYFSTLIYTLNKNKRTKK